MHEVSVANSVVLVTGTSREKGIGRALAEEALNRGANKVYATARDKSQLEMWAAKFQGKLIPVELDVTQPDQIQRAAHLATDTQILVNNAGTVGQSGCAFNCDEKLARREMEVNFFAPFQMIHAFSKHLMANKNCAIVNVVSIGGLYPSPAHITYSASKAALHSLTKAVRIEMMRHSIPVFGVYPGPIDTDMTDGLAVGKESSSNVANRVFDGMARGTLDITTDALSDHFNGYLKTDPKVIEALKKVFDPVNRT